MCPSPKFKVDAKSAARLPAHGVDNQAHLGGPQFRFWRLDVITPARWHPELDRAAWRRLQQETGGSDSRSPEARHLCDDLAGRRPRRPDAGHHDKIVIGSNLSPGLDRPGSAVVAKELQGPV